ncbi:hypothetical protein PHMEG_00038153 [Phytophthora megakarya]|uniref:DDE-1 domain-containing protein n=1 Tax=Phytophthora megakarya TaxID=4795 RepID=A0A225UIE4_9STRA|nr:hypothetical protein PHMEG_00038153 [Phytophthora megakarya]
MTAVITIRANEGKLPILFIVKGVPGGDIETDELNTYQLGHYYCVQENAWIDGFYASEVLPREMDGPSFMRTILIVTFLMKGKILWQRKRRQWFIRFLLTPLDVGIMVPLKSALRNTWIQQQGPSPKKAKEKRLDIIKRNIVAWNIIFKKTLRKGYSTAV